MGRGQFYTDMEMRMDERMGFIFTIPLFQSIIYLSEVVLILVPLLICKQASKMQVQMCNVNVRGCK